MPSDPLSRPLVEIARDLRERRLTARELVEAAIARHERFGERLHAYSFWAPEQARAVADAADAAFAAGVSVGPLQGMPVSTQGPVRRRRISLLCRIEPAAAGRSVGAGRAAGRDAAPPARGDHGQDPHGRVRVRRHRPEQPPRGAVQPVGRGCASLGRRFVERRRGQSAGRLGFARVRQRYGGLGAHSRLHDRQCRPEGHDSGAGPPKASCRCPSRSTRRGCWRAASPISPTALPRSIPPVSTRPRLSRKQARAT